MNLKKKTILAFTVKLLLVVTYSHAQIRTDSLKLKPISFLSPPVVNLLQSKSTEHHFTQIPGNFYTKQLPFFCNKEWKVQKAIGFPIKFRVGSVENCDKLEGKNQ